MKIIRRYHLQPNKQQTIQLPEEATILDIQIKDQESPVLWALVDPSQPDIDRSLAVYTTGTELPDDPGTYLGTFQLFEGSLEFHVFEGEVEEEEEEEE